MENSDDTTEPLQIAESIYNKGVFYFQNGNFEEAFEHFNKVLEIIPEHPYSYYFNGLIFKLKSDYQNADKYFSIAIKLKNDDPDFYHCLGLVNEATGLTDLAVTNFKKAISLFPENPEYYSSLGQVYHDMGMLKECIENYNQAVKLDNNNAAYLNNLGVVLDAANRDEDAVTVLSRAVELGPGNPDYYNNLGLALSHWPKEKIVDLMNYLKKTSDDPDFYYIPPLELKRKLDLAAENYLKAIALNPENPEYYNNLGVVLQRLDDYDGARENYFKAIELNPGNDKYYNNLATIYEEDCDYDRAIESYLKAIELNQQNKEIYQNLSLLYLLREDFAKSWENFELYRTKNITKKKFNKLYNKPDWNGEDINGKTIYVCMEQGLGDTLHYMRYLPYVKETGARVIFNCQPELVNVLKSAKGFDLIVSDAIGEEKHEFDTYVLLMSLCRIFTPDIKSIPAEVPYVYADPELKEKWFGKFKDEKRLKIGIVWRSKFSNPTFNKRSCPVEKFVELAKAFPEHKFYSMQKSPFEAEIKKFSLENLSSLSEEIKDFADSAAILEHLDLLITIDTSVTHLAGAMGKRVWNLIPFSPDWRWFEGREDSPWYPTMKLFRQEYPGDWDSVFDKVANDLRLL
jgi:Flp pilus assembly protein TadD